MKQVKVDNSKCIGCGACVSVDPAHFEFNDQGYSVVTNQDNLESSELEQAISYCPVDAITIEEDSKKED